MDYLGWPLIPLYPPTFKMHYTWLTRHLGRFLSLQNRFAKSLKGTVFFNVFRSNIDDSVPGCLTWEKVADVIILGAIVLYCLNLSHMAHLTLYTSPMSPYHQAISTHMYVHTCTCLTYHIAHFTIYTISPSTHSHVPPWHASHTSNTQNHEVISTLQQVIYMYIHVHTWPNTQYHQVTSTHP